MEDMNLRQYVEILWRGRALIVGAVVIAIILGGVWSFVLLKPVYEATATLQVTQPVSKTAVSEEIGLQALLNSISRQPQMTMETYRQELINLYLLKRVVNRLGLNVSPATLVGAIRVTVPRDTNLLVVEVKYGDPAIAASIANTLVSEYVDFLDELNQQQIRQSTDYMAQQMKVQASKLNGANEDLKSFLEQPRGVDELQQEIRTKITLLTEYKRDLVDVDVDRSALLGSTSKAEAELSAQPEVLTTTRSIIDDPYLQGLASELGRLDVLQVSHLKMENQEVNPTYVSLNSLVANSRVQIASLSARQKALLTAVAQTEKELEGLRVELAGKQLVQNQLGQKVKLLETTYELLSKQYEETRISESAKVAQTDLIIVSHAFEDLTPIGPHRILNTAVAAVMGLLIGVLGVFFDHAWRTPGSPNLHTQA